ncbi:SRPBCC family protein [Mycolicibacterium stellerae]|uniref:SRPBCC family protein n=1 Tax=Mycolicibacterium stellerae TaxID=2358193 RepID=UPI000F0B39B9|nr:SRPBCC family protein [Mycolicibacterium stellerae]
MTTKLARTAAAAGVLYAARRYYRNWGTTKGECEAALAGDELIKQPAIRTTEGITIHAPAEAVWQWLVQIGQDRGGLYSYQAFEDLVGLDYRNAERIHPEWQMLAPGDHIRLAPQGWLGLRRGMALVVEHVAENSTLILRGAPPEFPWQTVMSFHVLPRLEDRCRLLIRTRTALRHPGEALLVELAGPAMSLLTRGMLLGIKHRAEGQAVQTAVNSRSGSEPNMNRLPLTLNGRIRT